MAFQGITATARFSVFVEVGSGHPLRTERPQ
jgi:hypothetical protein